MGDIWPYGPPRYTSDAAVRQRLGVVGFRGQDVNIGLAIAHAEGGLDLSVINDTPATGDYSVGTWQINYYGSLYAGRAAEFGTPRYLVTSGLNAQAYACRRVFLQQGWHAWSTYTSGAYRKYLHGGAPGGSGGGKPPPPPGHKILPPTEDYSPAIHAATGHVQGLGDSWKSVVTALQHLGG
jgi:hypothetical protein